MHTFFVWFWTAMIWASIAWYGYLLFHVGYRGGRDIIALARSLSQQKREADEAARKAC